MNQYFSTFASNSDAGFSNQSTFENPKNNVITGRVFYRITAGGTHHYSLLFSDTVDSTFHGGTANRTCGGWQIHSAKVARVRGDFFTEDYRTDTSANQTVTDFVPLTFDGQPHKAVQNGELFACDPVTLTFEKHDYLCLQMTVSGACMPCHPECTIPVYVQQQNGCFAYDRAFPCAIMIGCDRPVKHRVGFFGDSITQGIGPAYNSYRHWAALVGNMLGDHNAYWNLGIGCGRASDAATNGIWMHKALQCDTVFVCFGVNDLSAGCTTDQIIESLTTIVHTLKAAGKTVILQTIPPFDYDDARTAIWQAVNTHIKAVLAAQADLTFDCVPHLCGDKPQLAKYEGHPNEEGSLCWANALYAQLSQTEVLA